MSGNGDQRAVNYAFASEPSECKDGSAPSVMRCQCALCLSQSFDSYMREAQIFIDHLLLRSGRKGGRKAEAA
jgi:hypothetical protein